MVVHFEEAMIRFTDSDEGGFQEPYNNVVILANGWVKADVRLKGGGVTETYYSPNQVEEIYEP